MEHTHNNLEYSSNKKRLSTPLRIILGAALLIGLYIISTQQGFFWASIVGIPFNGTTPPVAQVVDYDEWAKYASYEQMKESTFSQVPLQALRPLPNYTGGKNNDSVFSVAWMGAYDDRSEGAGSHPGVDIRLPIGTPILSIANGVVYQTKESGGFGKTIVVKHPDVPSPDNPKKLITIYSNYAHLSRIDVSEGQMVNKGQQIGLSGDTGFATGPHLDFSINIEDAPWYPYWPFSSSEASNAGYDFVAAVNAGFQQERVKQYTLNPLVYIQTYRNYTVAETAANTENNASTPSANTTPRVTTSTVVVERTPATNVSSTKSSVRAVSDRELARKLRIEARIAKARQREKLASTLKTRKELEETVVLARSPEPTKEKEEVTHAPATVTIKKVETTAEAPKERSVSTSNEIASLEIFHDEHFRCGLRGCRLEKVTLTLLDSEGNIVTNPSAFTAFLRLSLGRAELSQEKFDQDDFVNGVASLRLEPFNKGTILIEAIGTSLKETAISKPLIFSRT